MTGHASRRREVAGGTGSEYDRLFQAERQSNDQGGRDDNVGEADGRFATAGEAFERAKLAEVHAAAARTQAKADVEKSADQARAAAEAHAKELRTTAAAAGAEISDSWDGIQKSWVSHVAEMRRNIDAKKSEIDAKRAESHADEAEADAIMAIDYAYATVEEAEYAVLDAMSARMQADDLALTT